MAQLSTGANKILFLQNDGPNTLYVGDQSVTYLTGQSIPVNGNMTIDNNTGVVCGICAAGETASVRVMGQVR